MALTGVIPAIAVSAGLLTLEPTSTLRQQYWPWLSVVVLIAGLLFSTVFWLVIVPYRDRDKSDKRGDKAG